MLQISNPGRGRSGKRVGTYSKGMRQKVGIGIAKETKTLLLYEPTSALNLNSSNEFSDVVISLPKSGTAIKMATHDISGRVKWVRTSASCGRATWSNRYPPAT